MKTPPPEKPATREIARYEMIGDDDAWKRLSSRFLNLIESILGAVRAPFALVESAGDVLGIFTKWAKSKVDRASLETEKLRAETITEYAKGVQTWVSAKKEARELGLDEQKTADAELLAAQKEIEKFVKLVQGRGGMISFTTDGPDGHLHIGNPKQLGEPAGDAENEETKEEDPGDAPVNDDSH